MSGVLTLLAAAVIAQVDGGLDFDELAFELAANEANLRQQEDPDAGSSTPPARFRSVTVSAPTQSIFGGLTNADTLAAAVKVDLAGVEAGVQFAPENLSGFGLQLASLEKGSRLGLTWVRVFKDGPRTYADLSDKEGKSLAPTVDRDAVIAKLVKTGRHFARLCDSFAGWPAIGAVNPAVQASEFCGQRPAAGSSFVAYRNHFVSLKRAYEKALEALPPGLLHDRATAALSRAEDDFAAIEVRGFNKVAGKDEVQDAVERWWKTHSVTTLGFAVLVDWFALVWGFEPACVDKEAVGACDRTFGAQATPSRIEPTAAFSYTLGRTKLTAAVGVPLARAARGDSFLVELAPKFGIDVVLFKPAREGPRVVLGLESQVSVALNRPAIQPQWVNLVNISPHLDVLVSDELSFRFAVPVKAEQKDYDADGDEKPERRGLQWTVPFTIATVLKLD